LAGADWEDVRVRSATWAPALHVAASCKALCRRMSQSVVLVAGRHGRPATVADSRVRDISRCGTAFSCSADGERVRGGLEGMLVERIRLVAGRVTVIRSRQRWLRIEAQAKERAGLGAGLAGLTAFMRAGGERREKL
jgi:hypothetical protein